MSEAEHMMEGVSKAETEEIGRGQPLPGLPVHGKKKKITRSRWEKMDIFHLSWETLQYIICDA